MSNVGGVAINISSSSYKLKYLEELNVLSDKDLKLKWADEVEHEDDSSDSDNIEMDNRKAIIHFDVSEKHLGSSHLELWKLWLSYLLRRLLLSKVGRL